MKKTILIQQRVRVTYKTEAGLMQAIRYINDGTDAPYMDRESSNGFKMKTYGKAKVISSNESGKKRKKHIPSGYCSCGALLNGKGECTGKY